jgi:hypothetical protein
MMRPGQRLDVRTLPLESQRAWEILEALRAHGERDARFKIMAAAGATDPVTDKSLAFIAQLFASLDMALDQRGVQRFKEDRGLLGGSSIGAPIALAYARALDGSEVLIRVSRADEAALSPNEKATLAFLRTFQKKRTGADLRPLKEALGLKNPPMSQAAWNLGNEYVGPSTVKEIAKASAMHKVPLGPELAPLLIQKLKGAQGKPGPKR